MNVSKSVEDTFKIIKIKCNDNKTSKDIKSLIGNPYTMNKTIKKLKKLQKKKQLKKIDF